MPILRKRLSKSFKAFFESERSSGVLMIICTVVSMLLANSFLGEKYTSFWHSYIGGMSLEHWINDGLMAIFFLLVGLEIKREFYNGELSNLKTALLPIFAALGGVIVPASIHLSLNAGTPTQAGVGIPMATDIAFAIGVLSLLGNQVPASLKVFLTALAVIDDLIAVIVIAVFYTSDLNVTFLSASLGIWILLYASNIFFRVNSLAFYLIGGLLMWFFMLKSGVHATVAGVLLAFALPFSKVEDDEESISHQLEHFLHKPVAFVILPIFAFANTAIVVDLTAIQGLMQNNELGIILGLFLGKPIGIFLLTFLALKMKLIRLPLDINLKHVFGAGMLGGIGFTMSIFITNLAFSDNPAEINGSKLAILIASFASGLLGLTWLKLFGAPELVDEDVETMDLEVTELPQA
ncbi:MAG: Na+/H+ antiporter NhaA [Acidobacteria bacterium]|nr:MAG: Na+/H+ antiporter NhaA [Acidobacteriota bacterium]GIU81157.1 MAG: Na(+)/H(+) antiporter NhaA [Pyrinomonadaceae bacterium]